MSGDRLATLGVLLLAALVVSIIGADAILHPSGPNNGVEIGALVSIASAAGGYFFHAQQTAFLGASLTLQRDAFVQALQAVGGVTIPTTQSATGGSPTSTTGPTSAPSNVP